MIKARIMVRVSSFRVSKSLVQSIRPDNLRVRGLKITSRALPRVACFNISCEGRIETFISTLEDLLRCVQAAKGTLHRIAEDKME